MGLFTPSEFESIIAGEYIDVFNKFFDSNNPPPLKAPVLHAPQLLNIGIDAEKLLRVCGEKLKSAGGQIMDETEFTRGDVTPNGVRLQLTNLRDKTESQAEGRLLVEVIG